MSTLPDSSMPDPNEPTFDPGMDVAILVFSHVEHVKTRLNLARVSKLWLQASKPAAAYPSRFDFDTFPRMGERTQLTRVSGLLDNDEALSLPYERVVGLLGEAANEICHYAAMRGSVRLLKWTRVNNLDWSAELCHYAAANGRLPALQYLHENGCPWDSVTCSNAAYKGHLPVLQYLHENGCPWNYRTCYNAAERKRWDCLKYAVDNKCPGWERHAKRHAERLRRIVTTR